MPWELLHLISTDFLFVSLFPCLFAWKKKSKWYIYIPSSWLRLLKNDNIITWQYTDSNVIGTLRKHYSVIIL